MKRNDCFSLPWLGIRVVSAVRLLPVGAADAGLHSCAAAPGYVDKPGGTYFGFLRCNFLPARIFVGDSVSTLLGLIFAIIGLSTVDRAVIAASLLLRLSCVRRQPAARGGL